MNRKSKKQAIVLIFLALMSLILINFLSSRHFIRLDLTEDKEYTLSPATKKLLANLDDPMVVKLFLSKQLPPSLSTLEQGITDLLDEYKRASLGRISINRIMPDLSIQDEQTAQMLGIPPLQLDVVSKDKQEVIKVYIGIGIFYGDKKEIIPVAANLSSLEYDLTSAFLKLTNQKSPVIGLFLPEDTSPNHSSYSFISQIFQKGYEVKNISEQTNDIINANLDALVLIEPRNISKKFISELDALWNNGTPIIILAGNIDVGDQMQATSFNTGLDDWLNSKGITLSKKLVIDPKSSTLAAFSSGLVRYHIPYPFFIKVTPENMAKANPITAKLEGLVIPWSNSLAIDAEAHNDLKYETLLQTTDSALEQEGEPKITPDVLQDFSETLPTQKILSTLVTGPETKEGKKSKLIVVANNQFVKDNFLNDFDANILFLLNTADFLTWGDDLIGIRSRGKTDRPLTIPAPELISFIQLFHLIIIPLGVIGFGIILSIMRKKKWKKLRE